jgi:dihydroflavonol-4-reductase
MVNLVTGGSGFIGRHLVRLLAERGENVRVLDPRPFDGAPTGIDMRLGSILDKAALSAAMAGATRVFHLAGNPNLWAANPEVFHEINYEGTCRVLEAANWGGIARFIHTSTESILKKINAPRGARAALIDERVSLSVDDVPGPYCRSKYRAEQAALAAAQSGMPVVIVNPTMPIGPGDMLLTPPSKMILGFLNATVPAFLENEFNLVDARDAAMGHLLAAERGRIGERYILGHENLALSRLLRELEDLTGLGMTKRRVPYWVAYSAAIVSEGISRITKRAPIAPLTGVRLARSSMAFDCQKARTELGWQGRPLRQSLGDMVRDFQARGLLRRSPTKKF